LHKYFNRLRLREQQISNGDSPSGERPRAVWQFSFLLDSRFTYSTAVV